MENEVSWQYLSAEETVSAFSTDGSKGLGRDAVSDRRARFGGNRLWEIGKVSLRSVAVKYLLDTAAAFLLADLLCAAFAGFDLQFALILIISVAFIAFRIVCDIILVHLAARAAENEIPETLVLRGGKTSVIPATELVPGDIVLISEGDIVPADVRLIAADSLVVSEKGITGNEIPVEKTTAALVSRPSFAEPENMSNMLFAFSYVLRGNGRGVCVATGERTLAASKGKIQKILPKTSSPVQKKAERLAAISSSALMVAALLYIFIGLFAFKGKFTVTGIFLGAISFAVAGFGTIYHSLILSAHSLRMVRLFRVGATVRSPEAVEVTDDCGAFVVRDVSCLTDERLDLVAAVVCGKSYEPDAISPKNVYTRDIFKMIALASGTSANLVSSAQSIGTEQVFKWTADAFLDHTGMTLSQLVSGASPAALFPKGENNPLDTAIWYEGGTYHAACVGDLARILSVCKTVVLDGFEETLTREKRSRYLELAGKLEERGCRIFAVAHRIPPTENFSMLPVIQNSMGFVGFVAVRCIPSSYTKETVNAFSSPERTVLCFVSSRSDAFFATDDKMISGATVLEAKDAAEANSIRLEKGKNYVGWIPADKMSAADRVKLMLIIIRRLKKNVGSVVFAGSGLEDGVLAREASVRMCVVGEDRLRPAPYSLTASAQVLCRGKGRAISCEGVAEMIRGNDNKRRFGVIRTYLISSQIGRIILLVASLVLPPVIPAVVYLIWGLVLDTAIGICILFSKKTGTLPAKPKEANDR